MGITGALSPHKKEKKKGKEVLNVAKCGMA